MNSNHLIDQFYAKNSERLTKFVQQLVRIDSVHGNETAVARVIQAELGKFGLRAKIIGDIKDRRMLVCDLGKRRGSTFMLNGHLDTVPFGDRAKWKFGPLSAKISGGRMYGRGTFDMKASVAAAAYAAIALNCTGALQNSGSALPGRLRLLFNYDEESGVHSGIREAIRRGIGADAAIVAEPASVAEDPAGKAIFIGAKGVYRFELMTIGKTGHTGRCGSGINAVSKMAKLLLALEKLKLSHKKYPAYPPPHITPGTLISGGAGINIYPDSCSAAVDCRLTLGQSLSKVKAEIHSCLEAQVQKDAEIKYRIKDICNVSAGRISEDHPLVAIAGKTVKDLIGRAPQLKIISGVTDGNLLLEAGVPNLGFGVTGGGAHAENEFIEVRDLSLTSKAFALTAQSYLRR